MIKGIARTTAIFLFLVSAVSYAEVKSPELSVICRLQKNVRTLRVEKVSDGNCRTIYTKAGQDQNIGNAQSAQSCEDILNKVRDVLEKANWKCKEVQESRVSNLIDIR